MRTIISRTAVALLIVTSFAGSAETAFARGNHTILRNTGPIIIDGPIECEKKLVLRCRWEGDRRICEYVPSDECEMY